MAGGERKEGGQCVLRTQISTWSKSLVPRKNLQSDLQRLLCPDDQAELGPTVRITQYSLSNQTYSRRDRAAGGPVPSPELSAPLRVWRLRSLKSGPPSRYPPFGSAVVAVLHSVSLGSGLSLHRCFLSP